jgi:hypothetical protein
MAWELTGNADVTAASFLGSTNAQPLVIRTGITPSPTPPERLRVAPDGKVGIGTTTPQARLSVVGDGATINGVAIGANASGLNYPNKHETVGVADPANTLRLQSPNGLAFHTGAPGAVASDNLRVTITPGGEVGIGRAPGAAYRLDVAGTVNAADYHKNGMPLVGSQWASAADGGISYGGNVGIGTNDPREKLDIAGNLRLTGNNNVTTRRGVLHMGTTDGSQAGADEVVGGVGFWGFGRQHGQLSFRVGRGFELVDRSPNGPSLDYAYDSHAYADLKLRNLLATGNTGVGTGDPKAKLHVSSGEAQVRIDGSGNRTIVQIAKDGALQWDFGVGTGAAGNQDFWFGDFSSYRLLLQKGTGNVGIGTTGPTARLSVAGGGATVNGVTIGTDIPGIDYPFEYESVGVTQTNFNLRLQSPNWIFFHTGDALQQKWGLNEAGDWIKSSSRALKENIENFPLGKALTALAGLKPVTYNWTDVADKTECLGFIAEDTPSLVATADKKAIVPFNILTILTRVVQEQQRTIEAIQQRFDRSDV